MTATEHDTESMNRHVEQMVQEAILASGVERVMNEGVEENIFSDSFAKEVEDIKMPFTKFQILCKLVAKAINTQNLEFLAISFKLFQNVHQFVRQPIDFV